MDYEPRPESGSPPGARSASPQDVRDSGLRRVSSLTSWLAIGALGLVAAFAGIAAAAKPGRSTGTTVPRHAASPPATSSAPAPTAGTGAALAPPVAPPLPAPSAPTVVSGGS